MKKVFLSFFLISVMMVPAVIAEDENQIQTAQSSLDYSLSTLRRSVEKLAQENRELAAANDKLRGSLDLLMNELASLQRDDSRVLDQFSSLEDKYQKKMISHRGVEEQVARLEEEALSLGRAMTDMTAEIAAKEQADGELRLAAETKEQAIRDLMAASAQGSETDMAQLTGERDQLQEQSRAGLLSLQRSREEWLELQGAIQRGPGGVETLKKDRDRMVAALDGKKASNAKLTEELKRQQGVLDSALSPEKIGPVGISGLEQDVRALNEKYQGRNKDLAALQKSADNKLRKANDPVENERLKLEGKIAEASERNKSLRSGMDQLRRKMVDMDKKKVALEKVIYRAY